MRILITGGAGYIGSHTCVQLLGAGHEVVILDNFSNSDARSLGGIRQITGREPGLIRGDVRDQHAVSQALAESGAEAVLHFAALKAVGESWQVPLAYYDNNVSGTVSLLRAMQAQDVCKFVFSSSATVYGHAPVQPVSEGMPLGATNPYARTKLFTESLINDLARSWSDFEPAILRYFNPAGAHESGLIGEQPLGVPNNLVPFVSQTAAGLHPFIRVFGRDYPTPDGTGVRDYIHVVDLADAHVRTLESLRKGQGVLTLNLGTGNGSSVLDVVETFKRVSGQAIDVQFCDRREGDVAISYAHPGLAEKVLGWKATRDLEAMCRDAWRWQRHLSGS